MIGVFRTNATCLERNPSFLYESETWIHRKKESNERVVKILGRN